MELKKQEVEGSKAYMDGQSLDDNPYDEQTYFQEWAAWKQSFEVERGYWENINKGKT